MEDALVAATRTALDSRAAATRDVSSLQNWIDGNGCLSRVETEFLKQENDLMAVSSADETLPFLETLLVKLGTNLYKPFCKASQLH